MNSSSSSDSGFVLASVDSVKEHLNSNIQLTIQGKDRVLTWIYHQNKLEMPEHYVNTA